MPKKLTEIKGIGEKTEKDLRRSIRGSRSPRIGEELTVEEVQRADGGEGSVVDVKLQKNQQKALATEIGRPVAGTVGSRDRSGRSSKIPEGFSRKGEFLFESGQRTEAAEIFNSLPQDRQDDDKGERARVTTDLEEWENNISGLDFPGIDTPKRKPREKDKDIGFTVSDL